MNKRLEQGQELDALHYPVRFSSEHLIKAVSHLRGMSETETRKLLSDLYEANDGVVFASLVDFLAASFLGR